MLLVLVLAGWARMQDADQGADLRRRGWPWLRPAGRRDQDVRQRIGGGVLALLSGWSVYVLILSAVIGFALAQSALQDGRPGARHGVEQLRHPVLQRDPGHRRLRREAGERVSARRLRPRRADRRDRWHRLPRGLRVPEEVGPGTSDATSPP